MTVLKGKHTAEKRPKIAFKKACAEVFLNGDIIEFFFAFKEQPHYVNLVVQLAISPLVNKQWAA